MRNCLALVTLFLFYACADEVLHDEHTGRNVAGIEVEKSSKKVKKGGDPFKYQCQMNHGVFKQGGCYCKDNKEFFNPFSSSCD